MQKTDGWFQFYVQAGAYDSSVARVAVHRPNDTTMTNTYGPVPVGFLKLQAGKNTSFLVGALPTLIGAEYTFTFQNMNIERGLLWNQETAVSRGIQVNQTMGKFTASFSWNDGYYSNRYSWLIGIAGLYQRTPQPGFRGRRKLWRDELGRRLPRPCRTTAASTT